MDEYRKYEPIFGTWYLSKLIGKGSFGKVFEITKEEYGTIYRSALKVVSVPQDEDDVKTRLTEGTDLESISEYYEGILKEIINENVIMAKLKGNSNIVSYEDHQIIPHEESIGYDILIRMELLTPLLDRMVERKLNEKEVVKLGIDICKALETCHKKNIIHRDIKPQNIFISDNGDFKLGDFGIARTMEKTTGGMSKKGTYKYMAPEVFKGENYDSTVDIYSLGIVLYSLLNGNRGPFLPPPPAKVTHNDEEEARMRRFRGEPIPAPKDAGPMLVYIIQKACANDPRDRYQTAERMRRDLESYLNNYDEQQLYRYGDDRTEHIVTGAAEERTMLDESIRNHTDNIPASQMRQAQYNQPQYAQPRSMPAAPVGKKSLLIPTVIIAVILGIAIIIGAVTGAVLRGSNSEEDRTLMKDYGCIGDEASNDAMVATDTIFGCFGRGDFTKVVFLDSVRDAPEDAADVSSNNSGKVKAWIDDGTLYIAAKGGVIANRDSARLFACCDNLEEADFNNSFDTQRTERMAHMFYNCKRLRKVHFDGVKTSNVTTMQRMFTNCTSLTDPDVSDFDMSNVNSVYAMFRECTSLQQLDISGWDTSNVYDISRLFEKCTSLSKLDMGNLDTSSVTTFKAMFYNCYVLGSIDVSSFDTSNAINMYAMFSNCYSIRSLNVDNFETSNVTDMAYMFNDCKGLAALDVSGFDVSNTKSAQSMFYGCRNVKGYEDWPFDEKDLFGY